ncbi:hypothetical protein PtrSN002B_002807 [Pyrenophora tritici-repentis]|uniref:Tymo-45kd-70kd domain containing protein n=2 Tax=Pyrenophora tritici-repentis TaxID=45151 RepID=A0A2W1FE25_9PLEO|nr:uncharacterized protein PTRG_01353 [Pyrenophora tritici-repentis Pt-1C-BFP]KAA8626006.1 hypothetical protein PtrV1_01686 [Pyrenophora tritici-repentis]EDU40791.1 predicted protein [Pyrenophora tritici-repentis Pt-1C-BFP]KAF7454419.1 hypothetical protein A1F99_016770 [Pyrenophora tritici-repentis]KAF7577538.1 Tymo-45kd-70kd domain containing protein [Pyrenophora tritici-repentis]KAG9388164.1 hypothetical protein A1F94_001056 [Pyrenophora tritici-repentis]
MTFGSAQTYQFALTAKECAIFRAIRNVEPGLVSANLPKTLELSVKNQDGGFIGSCTIETRDMFKNFVSAAVGFYEELIKDPAGTLEPVEPELVYTESATQTQEITVVAPDLKSIVRDMSWVQIREAKIPACVKQVAFTIDDHGLTPDYREELQSEYPGVAILTPSMRMKEEVAQRVLEQAKAEITTPMKMEEEMTQGVLEQAKPKGVTEMIIELDEAEVAQNPLLEKVMRDRHPWATIESRPSPSISRKRTQRTTESRPSSPRRPDPLEHLKDLADFAVGPDPPADDEFGYRFAISTGWNTLSYPRKLEIAHARAIQHHYGKVADGLGCSHCVEKGYQCKVYLPQLCNLSHIAFGQSCQNCRLQGVRCDLPAATRERMPVPTGPAALRLDTQNVPSFGSHETPYTPPPTTTSNTPKPNLASRITNVVSSGPDSYSHCAYYKSRDILQFADEINYRVPGKARIVISAMYGKLWKHLETEPYGKRFITLMLHYENLITLYVLTYLRKEYEEAFQVLLRFQHTNCNKPGQLPEVDAVLPLFEWLPADAPLRRWVAILFATRWNFSQMEAMELQVRQNEVLKTFVHEVAAARGSSDGQGVDELQKRWCEVHLHELGSEEHQECERMEESLEEEVVPTVWRDDRGREAVGRPTRGSSAGPVSPVSGSKRRADDDTAQRPFKWRGSARGRGRGGRGRGRGESSRWDD